MKRKVCIEYNITGTSGANYDPVVVPGEDYGEDWNNLYFEGEENTDKYLEGLHQGEAVTFDRIFLTTDETDAQLVIRFNKARTLKEASDK